MSDQWAATMGALDGADPFSSDQRPYARIRKRVNHKGSPVGTGQVTAPTVNIDVSHLAWQNDARCAGTPVDHFFPTGPAEGSVLRLCGHCPVAAQCLQYAMERPYLLGIWAGTSELERKRMRRRAAAVRRDPDSADAG